MVRENFRNFISLVVTTKKLNGHKKLIILTCYWQATPQRTTPSADTVKEKCRKFLANLLELSSREPKAVERNVRNLIQELVDTKVEPEEFCDRLERLLNASPQPCLIGFLKVRTFLQRDCVCFYAVSTCGVVIQIKVK